MTVYVIQCQQTFNVKIGYTSRLVQSRLSELRTAASTPIELVKWYPRYSEADEQALHEVFAKYRVTGEWFKSDVLTLIDHEVQKMAGVKDYEAIGQNGAAIAPAVMTVNVAVLKIGTQNMKRSFFDQLPFVWMPHNSWTRLSTAFGLESREALEKCENLIKNGKLWGKIKTSKGVWLLYEFNGQLIRMNGARENEIEPPRFSRLIEDAQQLFLI